MELALEFGSTKFEVVDHNGRPWLQARQLGEALGYSRPDAILNIYDRNKDEFTTDMTTTIELMVGVVAQKVRIFSPRGCHLLSMFARTPVAKQFRKWVLDVLDKLATEEAQNTPTHSTGPDSPIGPADQNILQAIVRAKVAQMPEASSRGGFPQIWSRFNNHFRLGSYKQLPQSKMAEAVEYLVKLDVQEKKELPQSQPLFPSAIASNIPGPQSGDKYHAYLEKVEKWRVATVAERKNLYNEGIALLDPGRMGSEMFYVCADYLSLWLKDGVLSSDTSVFDELLRYNRAPVMLAKFLNTNFESVEKYLK